MRRRVGHCGQSVGRTLSAKHRDRVTSLGVLTFARAEYEAVLTALRPPPDVIVVLPDGYTPWPHGAPPARDVVGLLNQ